MILKVTITRIHQQSEDHCCNLLHKMILLEVLTVGAKLNKRGWFGWHVIWGSSTIYYSELKVQAKQYFFTKYVTKLKWSPSR